MADKKNQPVKKEKPVVNNESGLNEDYREAREELKKAQKDSK